MYIGTYILTTYYEFHYKEACKFYTKNNKMVKIYLRNCLDIEICFQMCTKSFNLEMTAIPIQVVFSCLHPFIYKFCMLLIS